MLPQSQEEIEKAAKWKWFFTGDGKNQFKSIPLHEDAQKRTDFWTPIGILRITSLFFGEKNASTWAQTFYRMALNNPKRDPPEMRDNIANFQDDFVGGHEDLNEMIAVFEAS